jgi:hypothetical protein
MVDPKKDAPPEKMIANFKDIQQAILNVIKNPHANANEQKDAVYALLQQLKAAVDDENFGKAQEIKEINDLISD